MAFSDLLYGLLPEHLLLLLLLLLALLPPLSRGRNPFFFATAGLLAAAAAALWQLLQGYSADLIPGQVAVDSMAILAKAVILITGLAVVSLAHRYPADPKFFLLLASSLLGALVAVGSESFITLYMGLEILAIPCYALLARGDRGGRAGEAAVKYVVVSSIGSGCLLFGIALIYGQTASMALTSLAQLPLGLKGLPGGVGLMFLFAGIAVKAAIFPFHAWAPDVYEGARLPVFGFMATVSKMTVLFVLARMLRGVEPSGIFLAAIALTALVSVIGGNLAAIRQQGLQRMLAYSSVAHAGYMLLAFLGPESGRMANLAYYALTYAAIVLLALSAMAMTEDPAGEKDALPPLRQLDDCRGLFKTHPLAAAALVIALLALAGFPPLPGFLAKVFIFKDLIASGYLGAAILGFAGSYLGIFYYLRIVFSVFSPVRPVPVFKEERVSAGAGVLANFILMLLLIFFPLVALGF
jgi:NADH-quinone oxidoreductase subunit N